MDDHIRLIKAHYCRDIACRQAHETISSNLRHKLERELQDSGYASFKKSIVSQYLSSCTLHSTFQTKGCTIHIVSQQHDMPPELLIVRVARRVQCLLDIYGITKHLTFWLIPAPHVREFPRETHTLISPEHINGGFTYSNLNTIFIFRREEFPKVVLHETLHHAKIDTHYLWKPSELAKLYAYFRLDATGCNNYMQCTMTDMRPNEAWIEAWAELYHISFLHLEYNMPWNMLWKAERDWACMQAARVLHRQHEHIDGLWRETTHAFSYMVIRAALIWHAQEFLQMNRVTTTADLANFMIRCFEDASFQKSVQSTRLSTHTSFRMTVFGDL